MRPSTTTRVREDELGESIKGRQGSKRWVEVETWFDLQQDSRVKPVSTRIKNHCSTQFTSTEEELRHDHPPRPWCSCQPISSVDYEDLKEISSRLQHWSRASAISKFINCESYNLSHVDDAFVRCVAANA